MHWHAILQERSSRRALQAIVRILDDEAGAQVRNFAGQAGEPHGIQQFVEILVSRRGFVLRIVGTAALVMRWCTRQELNLQPRDPKSRTLSN